MPGIADRGGGPSLNKYSCTPEQLDRVTQIVGGDGSAASSICSTVNVGEIGETAAALQWLVKQVRLGEERASQIETGLDTAFLLASAYQVFIMQLGFALYAAGVVRAKNVVMILLKNFMDACIACISFWLVGFAFAFGKKGDGNGFIGNWDFALSETAEQFPAPWAFWFWNWAFAAASTTILSGSIAERATFHSYLIYSFFMTTWVYPVVAHWLWSPQGWLSAANPDSILGSGAIDFSGSAVVHMVGGFASLIGSLSVGPRTGRFEGVLPPAAFKGNSAPLYVLGTLLLWFGWYGFNPGSHLAIHSHSLSEGVARTAVTTTLAAGSGAIATLALTWHRTRCLDLLQVCTGLLAGLVSVTASCSVIEPWAAVICGVVAAPVFVYGELLVERLLIDDPVSAFPVHGLCGIWGVLFTGLLAKEEYIVEVYGKEFGKHLMGIFYGGHAQLLLCQFITILVVIGWVSFWMLLLFGIMSYAGILRVPLEQEAMGLDRAACGDTNGMVDVKSDTKFTDSKSMILASTVPSVNWLPTLGSKPLTGAYPQVRTNGGGSYVSGNGPALITIREGHAAEEDSHSGPNALAKAGAAGAAGSAVAPASAAGSAAAVSLPGAAAAGGTMVSPFLAGPGAPGAAQGQGGDTMTDAFQNAMAGPDQRAGSSTSALEALQASAQGNSSSHSSSSGVQMQVQVRGGLPTTAPIPIPASRA